MADEACGLGKAPEVIRADVVLMDLGLTVGTGCWRDGESYVGSGIQLSDVVLGAKLIDGAEVVRSQLKGCDLTPSPTPR